MSPQTAKSLPNQSRRQNPPHPSAIHGASSASLSSPRGNLSFKLTPSPGWLLPPWGVVCLHLGLGSPSPSPSLTLRGSLWEAIAQLDTPIGRRRMLLLRWMKDDVAALRRSTTRRIHGRRGGEPRLAWCCFWAGRSETSPLLGRGGGRTRERLGGSRALAAAASSERKLARGEFLPRFGEAGIRFPRKWGPDMKGGNVWRVGVTGTSSSVIQSRTRTRSGRRNLFRHICKDAEEVVYFLYMNGVCWE